MCNLYRLTTTQEAMRQLFQDIGLLDRAGNLPEVLDIYPDYPAPIIRNAPEGPELVKARWGLPTPRHFLVGKKTDRGVTNVRNTGSPHWRPWLGPAFRCLVPFNRFAEPDSVNGGNVWFALPEDRLAFFAGVQVPGWTSVRKLKDGQTTDDLFGFLTCDPNEEVRQIHPKAMPVILTTPDAWRHWLTAPWSEVSSLQRPLPDGSLFRAA
jgi:putative SOS response-associated peptidase YedK